MARPPSDSTLNLGNSPEDRRQLELDARRSLRSTPLGLIMRRWRGTLWPPALPGPRGNTVSSSQMHLIWGATQKTLSF